MTYDGSQNGNRPDWYDGRHVDLGPLLEKPPQPVPWRVTGLVADGTVTIVAAEAGCGKSWVGQAFCVGVTRGHLTAGLVCRKGKALYVDAEMGPQMFVDHRLRPAGVTSPEFEYIDAMGLDVSLDADLDWLKAKIIETEAKFVVIDSLRRLSPSKSENDSDDMAPTVAAIAKLARDTGAAILLIHHKGDSTKLYRGSTAIKDQCDALFGLLRIDSDDDRDEDNDDDGVRRLTCRGGRGKAPRYALEPKDVYLAISPRDGGAVECDPPERKGARPRRKTPTRDAVKAQILATLPAETKTGVADAIGRSLHDNSFRQAWDELAEAGQIAREVDDEGVAGYIATPREPMKTTTPPGDPSSNGCGHSAARWRLLSGGPWLCQLSSPPTPGLDIETQTTSSKEG